MKSKLERRQLTLSVSVAIGFACTVFSPSAEAQWTIQVNVQPDGDREPISPWIYGINTADGEVTEHAYPLVRWGGNHTSRYNWEYDITNRASDWYFINIPYENSNPEMLPDGSIVDRLIEYTFCQRSDVLLTIPTMGWLPHDREYRWGFSVTKYGPQQRIAPGHPDAGNGVRLNGEDLVIGNDPLDTSRVSTIDDTTAWLTHLSDVFGPPGDGGVRLYALDNEPMSWHETHRDVHPLPTTYDEVWEYTAAHAAAIKAFDPDALITGPVLWGWCAYWSSAADQTSETGGCGWGPDRLAHGDLAFVDWYLQQVCAYEEEHGVRLIDYLDIHYYPAAWDVALTSNEAADVAARRLRSVRTLYDPDYWDESWINLPINLLPMMNGIIADNCPGLGLAVTEYNWGNDEGASSALAQAEVLAIFGRYGVDIAARWVAPKSGSPVEDAFLLYLSYDGSGSQVMGDSIAATSADVLNMPAYAVAGDYGRLYTLLFNKTDQVIHAVVTSTTTLVGEVEVYGFDAETVLGPRESVDVVNGTSFTVVLPPMSATLAVASDGTLLPGDLGPGDYDSDMSCGFDDLDAGDAGDAPGTDVGDAEDAPLDIADLVDTGDAVADFGVDQPSADLPIDTVDDGSTPDVPSDGSTNLDDAAESSGGGGSKDGFCSSLGSPGHDVISRWCALLAVCLIARRRRERAHR